MPRRGGPPCPPVPTCTVSVVIVNWNSGPRLDQCLSALAASETSAECAIDKVVVVDNASTDDSLERALGAYPTTHAIHNRVNRGFASACNQGALAHRSEFLLFLNPDTQVQVTTIGTALAFLRSSQGQRVGVCGVQLLDSNLAPTTSAARFPSLRTLAADALGLSSLFPSVFPPHLLESAECRESRAVDQISGAFFLVRRSVYDALSGFDERFFMYYEEVDLSYRATQLGWISWLLSDAACYHEGGGSSRSVPAVRLFYNLRSRLQFAHKHFSPTRLLGVAVVTILVEGPTRLVEALVCGSSAAIRDTVIAYVSLGRWLAGRLVSRGERTEL